MRKATDKIKWRDDTARIVAKIHGVSQRYVIMVRNGERENEEILQTLVDFEQGKSKLIQELIRMVPLTKNQQHAA
jgi:hypothetical protein